MLDKEKVIRFIENAEKRINPYPASYILVLIEDGYFDLPENKEKNSESTGVTNAECISRISKAIEILNHSIVKLYTRIDNLEEPLK